MRERANAAQFAAGSPAATSTPRRGLTSTVAGFRPDRLLPGPNLARDS